MSSILQKVKNKFNFCFDFVECKQITSCLFCGFMLCSFHSPSLNTMSFGYASLQFTETSCWVTMQVSYMILAQVSPVTHSVGNCVKRVIVIVTSVLFFRTPVSTVNALGKPAILSKFSYIPTVFIVTMVGHLRGGWKG